ncbi:MAG: DUF1631 family protein [Pseudomonadota bacterium]
MSEQPRERSEPNNVVQLNPDRGSNNPAQIVLARLPAAMHSLRDKARQQLQGMLRDLFDKVDDAMFELADKANNNHEQNLYFDSMREVRLRRRAMEIAFFRSIDIRFAQLLDHTAYRDDAAADNKEFSLDNLSLVQHDDLEQLVAVEAMTNKANEQFAEAIQHLTLRIDHLVPVKVYQKNNPLGVDVICNAFNEASKSLDIDVKAKLVLFKLFDNMVMTKLGDLFAALNQLLIDANIMTSLKSDSRPKRSDSSTDNHYGAGISASYTGSHANAGVSPGLQQGGPSAYDDQTAQVLHTLRDLLGSRNAVPTQRNMGEEIATQELVKILSLAQHQNSFNAAAAANSAQLNVRELLKNLLSNSAPNQPAPAINQVDDDIINLVSMMFDFILDDRNLAAPMKALIGRLQLPMVKVAIADKSFFSKGGHPARRLLNEMAMAALGWQESSEENQRKDSLFNKMEMTVQAILSDFETDMGIFNNLLTDFRAFLEKDKRRAQILEQRTIDAEDGKAKSEYARGQVDGILNRITSGHDLPAPAQKLLRDAWGNVLFITVLKQGIDSEEWQAAVRTAQQLVWSLTAPLNKENRQGLLKLVPELLQKLRHGLEDISFSPFETTQLFKQLEALHLTRLRAVPKVPDVVPPTSLSAGEPIVSKHLGSAPVSSAKPEIKASVEPVIASRPEITAPAKTNVPVLAPSPSNAVSAETKSAITTPPAVTPPVVAAVAKPQIEPVVEKDTSLASLETFVVSNAQQLSAAENELPEGDQHLALVSNITQGSWFEMQSDDGQKFRCRLAAIIRATGKYIFVNRSGMKVAEESRMSLALALKSGRLHLLDDGMLFDRALEAVIGNLRANR